MKKFKGLRYFLISCLIMVALAVNIGSIEDDDDDDLSDIQGVWKLKSFTSYNSVTGECETQDAASYNVFVKVSDDEIRTYYSAGEAGIVYCSNEDEDFDEDDDDTDYSLDGDTLTVISEDDDGNDDCKEKGVFEKASSSDISGATENCDLVL